MKYFLFLVFTVSIISTVFSQTRPKQVIPDHTPIAATHADSLATNSSWSFLSLEACGVESFLKQYPTADGRGTIICILDDGVDPGLEGLLQTSEGKTKIIDVQDFSKTGDLTYSVAEKKGDQLYFDGKIVLKGLDKVGVASYDGKYYYAVLPELRFQNGLGDLNFNGKGEDVFGVVIYQDRAGHYKAVVDGNADGDISDEKPLSSYHEDHDLFRFRASVAQALQPATRKNEPTTPKNEHAGNTPPTPLKRGVINDGRFLSGAVNIFPDEKRINIYFADGGHGTHVAGMAGGYRIDGQTGFNGLAPGAEMVALKFSDNKQDGITISGSMKKAYEYVIKLAEESGKPVIANMSFGIGSEIEGQSVMDEWLDSVLAEHPDVTVCISAGNDGPGLSNIGLPGSAQKVISIGAALPDDTGRDLFALKMSKPAMWDFSSRGGELAKPDVVAPGTAISTVPDYAMNDRYNGTSMASPYATGCCAVLISAMKQMFPEYKPNSYLIKRAMQMGASPIANMTPLDQGAGLINIPKAFQYLSSWYRNHTQPREYVVGVKIPSAVKSGTAVFYRAGNYPKGGEHTVFTITPVQENTTPTRASVLGFNAYELRSDASWLKPVQSSIYRRGTGALSVAVDYDEKQLEKPGIYFGKILAFPKGKLSTKEQAPEFELWNTVVIPHLLTPQNNYRVAVNENNNLTRTHDRQFIAVPPSTKALKITLTSSNGLRGAEIALIDNDGRTFSNLSLKKNNDMKPAVLYLTGNKLPRGVIEIVDKLGFGNDDEPLGKVNLLVEAIPLDVKPISTSAASDKYASASFEITNSSTNSYNFYAEASVEGYERYIDTTIKTSDEFLYKFKANPGENHAEFYLTLPREDYNKFTDIGLQILKPNGEALVNSAFDLRRNSVKIVFLDNDTTTYSLYFRGGYAVPDTSNSFTLTVRERRVFADEILSKKIKTPTNLESMQTENITLASSKTLPKIPEGFHFYGNLGLRMKNEDYVKVPFTYSK